MNLEFLYIHDFRSLKRASLNFNSNYRFSVLDGLLKLTEERVADAVDMSAFFSLGKRDRGDAGCITNVSAVIGANGSGKTTLAFVLQQLVRGRPEIGECLAVFSNMPGIDARFYVCKVESSFLRFTISETLRPNVQVGEFRPWRTMIYYSPLYTTQRCVFGDGQAVFDISATANMNAHESVTLRDGESGIIRSSQSNNYDFKETYCILSALNNGMMDFLPSGRVYGLEIAPSVFTMAQFLQVARIGRNAVDALDGEMRDARELPVWKVREPLRSLALGRMIDWARKRDAFILAFTLMAVDWIRVGVDTLKDGRPAGNPFLRIAVEVFDFLRSYYNPFTLEGADVSVADIHHAITVFLAVLSKKEFALDWYRGKKANEAVQSAHDLFGQLAAIKPTLLPPDTMGTRRSVYRFDGRTFPEETLQDLMRNHSNSHLEIPYLDIKIMPPLSSGEASLFLMFGHLLAVLQNIRCSSEVADSDHILLYLDECETALHPEWQRRIVSYVIEFCERCTESMDIQIVFASHSPMLLSDIPMGNVCFLSARDEEPTFETNTFGSNIFDLYRFGFNVLEGQWGTFAYGKIKALIEKAERDEPFSDAEKVVVSMIGDRFVNGYLKKHIRHGERQGCNRVFRGRDYLPETRP